ncbi:MAG: MBOAT family protein [Proteobacteria bacterium]|nr:MBOAT family protein [Pseudomonadota bacterium]
MIFNTLQFIPFFALVLALHCVLPWRTDKQFLLLASLFFYATFDPPFVLLLVAQSLIDWHIARALDRSTAPGRRKALLVASLVLNLGSLFFFKYYDFAAGELNCALALAGIELRFPGFGVVLPIGISFYTFHTLSYIIDVYRRRVATAPLLDYMLFVCFFTQLVAGPIVRAGHMLPQLRAKRLPSPRLALLGAWLVLLGYAKKVVIADNLASFVGSVFANPSSFSAGDKASALLGFATQIYCDFSGYSDIAIGLCLLMGIRLRRNFRLPYLARGLSDFWRRWHISLSSWIRDYLYIPLGGSRRGAWRTTANLVFVMALCGLWHGATWMFVLWGLMHGAGLAAEAAGEAAVTRSAPSFRAAIARLRATLGYRLLSTAVTLLFVVCGWALFRAATLADAVDIAGGLLTTIAGLPFGEMPRPRQEWSYVLVFAAVHVAFFVQRETKLLPAANLALRAATAGILVFLVATAWESGNAFIYFQF